MCTGEQGERGSPSPISQKKGVEVVYGTGQSPMNQKGTLSSGGLMEGGYGKKIAPPTAPKPYHHNAGTGTAYLIYSAYPSLRHQG